MKKTLLFLLLICIQSLFYAQTPKEQFGKANEAYADGNYKEATRLYEKLIAEGWQSSELHFNLANANYKKGEIAPSIYHYEMALLLFPGNKTYLNNLKFAEQKRLDEIEPVEKSNFDLQIERIINWFNLEQWARIAIGFAVISLFCFIGFLFLKKAMFKRLFFSLFIIFTLSCISAYYLADKQAFLNTKNNYAIIFADEAQIYDEPNTRAQKLFLLHEGTKVKVESEFREYTKIKLPNAISGWIETDKIKKLKLN